LTRYKQGHFISREGAEAPQAAMLKVKDWPPRSQFKEEMQRHYVVSDKGLLPGGNRGSKV
jgi:hypothetical protein